MSFWNYIGEFLLFRWLFGSRKHDETKHNVKDETVNPADCDNLDDPDSYMRYGSRPDNSCSRYDNRDYGYSQSDDDFLDEQDDYDMMDDDF